MDITNLDDIDFEIKKMKLVNSLHNDTISTNELVDMYGFNFLKSFVIKLSSLKVRQHRFRLHQKAISIIDALEIMYPIEEFPERWI